jgi:hypothetical protein
VPRYHRGLVPAACVLAAFTLIASAPAAAQKIEPGTWTGTITPPDQAAIPATFDVRVSGDTVRITANAEMGSIPFDDVKVLADRITFTFSPGDTHVSCVLMLGEGGSYKGDCTDTEGGIGVIVMAPPKKE